MPSNPATSPSQFPQTHREARNAGQGTNSTQHLIRCETLLEHYDDPHTVGKHCDPYGVIRIVCYNYAPQISNWKLQIANCKLQIAIRNSKNFQAAFDTESTESALPNQLSQNTISLE